MTTASTSGTRKQTLPARSASAAGGGAANDGAELDAIFRRFVDEQFLADWAEAKERLGDIDGLGRHLDRTPQQRRWDALMEMARRASSTLPGQNGCQVVANLVIDQHTFERYAAAHAGAPLAPDDPRILYVGCNARRQVMKRHDLGLEPGTEAGPFVPLNQFGQRRAAGDGAPARPA